MAVMCCSEAAQPTLSLPLAATNSKIAGSDPGSVVQSLMHMEKWEVVSQ